MFMWQSTNLFPLCATFQFYYTFNLFRYFEFTVFRTFACGLRAHLTHLSFGLFSSLVYFSLYFSLFSTKILQIYGSNTRAEKEKNSDPRKKKTSEEKKRTQKE